MKWCIKFKLLFTRALCNSLLQKLLILAAHKCFIPLQVTLSVFELASAAGFKCDIDPGLVTAISSMQTGNTKTISATSVHGIDLIAYSSGKDDVKYFIC